MSDVFEYLKEIEVERATMRRPFELEEGTLYPTYKFEVQEPTPDQNYRSIKAFIYYDDLKFYTFLPTKYGKMPQAHVDNLNDLIENKKPPSTCFYGKTGRTCHVEVHAFGQKVNHALLVKITRLESIMGEGSSAPNSPVKRGGSFADNGESPAKKAK